MTKKEIENINVAVMSVDNGTDRFFFEECELGLTHPSNDFPPIDDENISVLLWTFLMSSHN